MVDETAEFQSWVTFSAAEERWLQEQKESLLAIIQEEFQHGELPVSIPLQGDQDAFALWMKEWLQRFFCGTYDPLFWEYQIQTGERLAQLAIPLARWAPVFRYIRKCIYPKIFVQLSPERQDSLARHLITLGEGCQYAVQTGYLQQQSHDTLFSIRALMQIYDLEDFFSAAADLACDLAQAQGVGLILLDGEQLRYHLFHGLSKQYQHLSSLSFPKEEGISGAALRENRAIFQRDYPQSPQAMPAFVEMGLQGSLAFPLRGPDGPQGVLVLSWFTAAPPTRIPQLVWEHLRLLVDVLSALLVRQALEEHLQHLSSQDLLTGLPNRRVVYEHIHASMARSVRHQRLLVLFFVDVDGFKRVNDILGHQQGDAVLRQVAERLRSAVRAGDMVIRYAGDEFVLLIEDVLHVSEIEQVASRVLQALRFSIDPQCPVSASIGSVTYPFDEGSPEELLHHADQAMYVAKERGGNCWVPYGYYLQDTLQKATALVQELRSALAQRQFRLHWQPIVSLPGQQIIGAEALLRWQHPTQGLLAPAAFLDALEQSSLMIDVGQWIMDTAVSQAERWRQAGHDLDIHINLSARELLAPHWIDWCAVLLERHPQIDRERLHLEIVERVAVEDIPIVAKQIRAAKQRLGVQFVLDDFGTGASALQHLGDMDCSGIKIDQSMIRDLPKNPKHVLLVQGLLYLAKALSVEAVAEGVETAELAQLLTEMGIEKAQGYWFSKPVSVRAMDALLNA
ncbi:EAL domain-containing protein [Acidithiobacillus sp. CV18-2]|nr:EAL domain-containing protein [Acidithiobacillus caldus]MBU2755549.1 EAL domain-containing protein [Acidithiobacillus sp. CV18-3]MBU2756300.1 EAL domain-containing protein [Acidithiobacillus sp. BN09-2]MBU2778088.1 EAL domain-containing protein [Acidithiobacillus sp. CV18-2]MBU2800024.1 EAL domain-containing protein [Acidithiobacillus sp. VAN18-4]MBU2770405.1 EAL domain-containing protein [Acidithiobacillus caldus]